MPKMTTNAILSIAASDGRVFFVVPWFGYSLVGTTDTDYATIPRAPTPTPDVTYLLREAASIFPVAAHAPVYYGMAGVRALVRKEGVNASAVSRKHAIREHARTGWAGDGTHRRAPRQQQEQGHRHLERCRDADPRSARCAAAPRAPASRSGGRGCCRWREPSQPAAHPTAPPGTRRPRSAAEPRGRAPTRRL